MIYAYTGKTGSGKTFNMVRDAFREWRAGRDIYSNTILFFEDIDRKKLLTRLALMTRRIEYGAYRASKRGRIIYFEDISEILEARDGLILFDEAQVLFNARSWESLPKEFMYKLQQHRKHRLVLFCTTQNLSRIDIVYRQLVQYWWHFEPVFALGENPINLGLFRRKTKDVNAINNQVDDTKVPDLKVKFWLMHRFKKRLYDTFFDVGFRRFKTIWQMYYNSGTRRLERKFIIAPKEMRLSDALRAISLLTRSASAPTRSKSFRIA